MKAFVAVAPGEVELCEIPIPALREDEALVRIEACAFCNTTDRLVADYHYGSDGFPVLIGHESVGRVVEVGPKVRHLKVGDRVTRANAMPRPCGGYYSSWGGFAEYGVVQDAPVVPGLSGLPLERAVLLISASELASCAMAVPEIRHTQIAVTGTGGAALSFIYFAKRLGAPRVVALGRRPEALTLCRRAGADEAYLFGSPELAAAGHTAPVDYLFEATGFPGIFRDGVPLLREGGRLGIYGRAERPYEIGGSCPPDPAHQELVRPQERLAYETVCGLLGQDDTLLQLLITHRWRFDEMLTAWQTVLYDRSLIKGYVVMD